MSSGLAVAAISMAAIGVRAQPSAEEERLLAYQRAALDAICAHAKPGDALAPICGLRDPEAVPRVVAEVAARASPERALAAEAARRRALEERYRRRASREASGGRELTLIGPPGFGPEPTTSPK